MKPIHRIAATLFLATGLAGCGGIGEGNTIESLSLSVVPATAGIEQGVTVDAGTPTERYYTYDCFCSNIAALATFTDGSIADFSNRVEWTSSDPAVAEMLNFDDLDSDEVVCPSIQFAAGMLIPRGTGQAVITATFGPLSATLAVEVADASTGTYVLQAAPPSDPANTDVAVGAQLPLRLTGTLDGRTRTMNRNVLTWEFVDDANADFASIDTTGVVRGVAPTGATARTARASFGTCAVNATALVNVGEILGPLTLEREAPDFAFDDLLATNSDEELIATGALDFDADGAADGEQLLSQLISLSYTDACELREFDATVPTTNCRLTNTTCNQDTPVCTGGNATTCTSTFTPCRTLGSPIVRGAASPNQIVSFNDYGTPTHFAATFPGVLGEATTLSGAIDNATTTIVVAELVNYPDVFPWFAVIDAAGTREDVRVTAATETTLTVVRGVGGTAAAAHADGATFEERRYTTGTPLDITAKAGTLTTFAIDPPGTLDPLGTLQLRAEGTFVDVASASRQQRVTRLVAPASRDEAPTINWTSSAPTVATVSLTNGLMTSQTACGGRVTVRARADTSTDATTEKFDPDSTADDDACLATDPLCDQVEVCIATQSPLPLGTTCETTTTCP